MKDSNKKYVRKTFMPHQYEEESSFLSKMHEEGWRFVKLHAGIPSKYEFEACEPEAYTYQLDFIETEKDTEDYHQLYQDSGWEEVYEWDGINGKWYYFRKKERENAQKIYTDLDSKIDLFDRLSKRYSFFAILCILLELNGIRIMLEALGRTEGFSVWSVFFLVCILVMGYAIVTVTYMLVGMIRKKSVLLKQKEKDL